MRNEKKLIAAITTVILSFVSGTAVSGTTKNPLTRVPNQPERCSYIWLDLYHDFKTSNVFISEGRGTVYMSASSILYHGSRTNPKACGKKAFAADKIINSGMLYGFGSGVHNSKPDTRSHYSRFVARNASSMARTGNTQLRGGRAQRPKCGRSTHTIIIDGAPYIHYWHRGSGCYSAARQPYPNPF